MTEPNGSTRRDFLKTSTFAVGGAVATQVGLSSAAHAAGSDVIKVGLIGCGGRGTGAAEQICIASQPDKNVKLYAMGDLFLDHLETARKRLTDVVGDQVDVSKERCFTGFDAFQKVIDSGVDLVILASPPGFRPMMIEAAVKAGKNIFTEKPVAVDAPGIRKVLAAAEEAKQKGLAVVAGTQRRHQASYVECMKRIHDGDLGEITGGQCYWNQGGLWMKPRETSWSDMEWQVRNWLYFTWLSGDHIVEQHVHNLDVINWALGTHPERAVGMGGRQVRTSPDYGHIFDHFATDLEYPGGVHVMSMARQIEGCEKNISETVVGTAGKWSSAGSRLQFSGKSKYRFNEKATDPYVQEHIDLLASIRAGKPLNELRTVAESTLTAIMCRMSAYTGQAVTWEQALNSKQDLLPEQLVMGNLPVPPVAVPGQTPLI
ncbi:Gfo/Idh/MocA family oxidoreductase [Singulisphaera acidiphila]|uniref:Putative dehydrogenase n=1 Tax=Singulisphaera acidiphila (strain ATCC BAA-1392 / DSM 18658 / VKM B-2454 / MOB10) TaxID=886293 RepID=L0DED0_SINAD|nr:Gfo/Idh/MocA family oxidoreductase [Singulisphaera acidiphila]AGA27011.1 putative dehydrogenase [Singulisphaera acidiphila DSM 18658]